MDKKVIEETQAWLENVVIGLNLCPFAAKPNRNKQIKICVSQAKDPAALLTDLQVELELLRDTEPEKLETSILVHPNMLQGFAQYNDFLFLVEDFLQQQGWEGEFQVASFHPAYCFAGTQEDDAENLTNRSPYPMLHLIREDSLEAALDNYPDPDKIPERNIRKVEGLTQEQKKQLFPYLLK